MTIKEILDTPRQRNNHTSINSIKRTTRYSLYAVHSYCVENIHWRFVVGRNELFYWYLRIIPANAVIDFEKAEEKSPINPPTSEQPF